MILFDQCLFATLQSTNLNQLTIDLLSQLIYLFLVYLLVSLPIFFDDPSLDLLKFLSVSYLHKFQLFSKHFVITFHFKYTLCNGLHKFYIIDLDEPMKDLTNDFGRCYSLQFALEVLFYTLCLKLLKFFSDVLLFWHLKNYDILSPSKVKSYINKIKNY